MLENQQQMTDSNGGDIQQQEEVQFDDENEERNRQKLNIDELKYVMTLGKGGFGQVQLVMDIVTKKKYAKKQFNAQADYNDEISLVNKLEKEFGADINRATCRLEFTSKTQKILLYEAGTCSLQDLSNIRSQYRIYWWNKESELVHILKKIFQIFKRLHSKNLMHSDLKPQNIVLYSCSDMSSNIYDVKLIDFGAATFDHGVLKAYTMDYFVPNAE